MNSSRGIKLGFTFAGTLALGIISARADLFGTGPNEFTIDFVNIANPGNGDDVNNPSPNPGDGGTPNGGLPYVYRMGAYEISQDAIAKATASGLLNVTAGAWTGGQPAANMTWYEAAAFVNWLNTTTGHQAAYQLDGTDTTLTLWASAEAWQAGGENLYRHKDAYYFLPSEDEWYKAAYHKNDGVTANYWDYATGSNTIPTAVARGTVSETAVYGRSSVPAEVIVAGGLSAYGTMGQNGNVWEWSESALDGSNDSSGKERALRGGSVRYDEGALRSSLRNRGDPSSSLINVGFRVASVPEPSAAMLMIGPGMMWMSRRPRAAGR